MPRLVQLPISAVPSVLLHVADEAAYQTYLEQLAQHQKRFPETWARVPMTTEKPKSAKSRAKLVTTVSSNENSMHHHHHHHHHRSGSLTSSHSHSQIHPSPSPTSHSTPSSVSAEDAFVMSLLSLSHDDEPSHVTPSSPDPTLISTSSESTDAHVQSLPDLPVSHMDLPDLDEIAKLPPPLLLSAECTPLSELSRSSSMMLSNAPVLLSHLNHSASMPDLSNSTASVSMSSPNSSIVTFSSPSSHHHRRASTPLSHHRRRAQRVIPVLDPTLSPAIKRISSTLAQGGYRHHPYAHTRTSSQMSVPY